MAVLLLAVVMDLALGDPANRWHPVAWIGGLLSAGRRRAPRARPAALLAYGALLVLGTAGAAAGVAAIAGRLTEPWSWAGVIVQAWLLKCTFALRSLFTAVGAVSTHLHDGELGRARADLACHLVGRPTADLDAAHAASAAVESLAENLTDSLVAPLCFFLVGGLPAAWAYRAVNTADAMMGYREGDLEHLGKVAARADDALNFLPARLAAIALVGGAALAGASAAGAWRTMRADGGRTASPNAGWTMAAMAGALGVTLEKRAHYRLGMGPAPDPTALRRAMKVGACAAALCLTAALVVSAVFA